MEFKSLNDAFANSFIKSLPHLTRLDLTANEIKIIELVLSYTRNGQDFYMNHKTLADYLVLGNTKSKAKSVGNIIAKLRKKCYIETVTTHNYNGKNGGSSTTITVNETFLEAQFNAVFNPVEVLDQNTPQALPVLDLEPIITQLPNATPSGSTNAETLPSNSRDKVQTAAEFVAELEAMDDEPSNIPDLPCLANWDSLDEVEDEAKLEVEDFGYNEIETASEFKALLYRLLRLDGMDSKRSALLHLIDNKSNYDLGKLKGAFEALILTV
ncbi:hypothetical protein [Flavobacterium sp.]|uniref:hypothetical protein n=1 Tax=Flavobacterium sp. TaxID=239 RepID=UPI0039E6DE09